MSLYTTLKRIWPVLFPKPVPVLVCLFVYAGAAAFGALLALLMLSPLAVIWPYELVFME